MSSAAVAGAVAASALAATVLNRKYKISTDLGFLRTLVSIKLGVSRMKRDKWTVADFFESMVDSQPDKPAIKFVNSGEVWTFVQLDRAANRVAHWALSRGFKTGDVVALFMTNRPEFIATWLGLAKVGVVVAFLNHNLKGKPLMHCIGVSKARAVMFDEPLRASVEGVRTQVEALGEVVLATLGDSVSGGAAAVGATDVDLSGVLPAMSAARPLRSFRSTVTMTDPYAFVYTSGTTGMPKAAIITHLRLYIAGRGFALIFKVRPDDVVYTALPLYHSAGGMIGVGLMLFQGATMVLRDKFSRSNFWSDCAAYKCTVVQYIGELCRYLLLANPPHPMQAKHNVRIAIGNGLRPDIWEQFQTRFNIPEVGEFYGATEGNVALFNHCTTAEARGAVGVAGALQRLVGINVIVKYDEDTQEPQRGRDGFCIKCPPGEAGEMLGKIDQDDPTRAFQGYHGNDKATNSKVIRDVFAKGDMYFRTGDLLKIDSNGYYHFVDRIGDTFRWKGENVATTEVSEMVASFPGIAESNVYGVAVPGTDGRAGMAALTLTNDSAVSVPDAKGNPVPLDFDGLAAHLKANLPAYAVPVFVRILPEVPITGTFKHQKVQLRKEGADPTVVSDPLFWMDPASGKYTPLDAPKWLKIVQGASKL